jgi:hypothetical protein
LQRVTQTGKEPAVTVRTLAVQADIPANGNGIKRNNGDEDVEPESQRASP